MKKFILIFIMLFTLCGCSDIKQRTNHIEFLEEQCEKYAIEKATYSSIWGVNQNLISIEHIENDVYNYKFFCQVFGNEGKTFQYYVVEIYYDIKSHDIIEYSIESSAYYLW